MKISHLVEDTEQSFLFIDIFPQGRAKEADHATRVKKIIELMKTLGYDTKFEEFIEDDGLDGARIRATRDSADRADVWDVLRSGISIDGITVTKNSGKQSRTTWTSTAFLLRSLCEADGVTFFEKPFDWADLKSTSIGKYRPIKRAIIKRFETEFITEIPRFKGEEYFGGAKPSHPMANLVKKVDWPYAILEFKDGTSYLVDSTQANSYIRMWALII